MRLFTEKTITLSFVLAEDGTPLKTDGGHYIIDLHLETINEPVALAHESRSNRRCCSRTWAFLGYGPYDHHWTR